MTAPHQFLIYQSEDGSTRIDVMLEAGNPLAEPEAVDRVVRQGKGTISEHIKHIFEEGELTPAATVRLFRTVQSEGVKKPARLWC